MLTNILLWLWVLDLGIVFGAGLYEARIIVRRWLGPATNPGWHADEAQRDDVGRRFWGFTTTVPLTLLTAANAWQAWHAASSIRTVWLVAVGAACADRILTFGYFIPRMVGLLKAPDSPVSRAQATTWARLNYLRLAFVLSSWLAALHTLQSLPLP